MWWSVALTISSSDGSVVIAVHSSLSSVSHSVSQSWFSTTFLYSLLLVFSHSRAFLITVGRTIWYMKWPLYLNCLFSFILIRPAVLGMRGRRLQTLTNLAGTLTTGPWTWSELSLPRGRLTSFMNGMWGANSCRSKLVSPCSSVGTLSKSRPLAFDWHGIRPYFELPLHV